MLRIATLIASGARAKSLGLQGARWIARAEKARKKLELAVGRWA
jgi:hypothetical protein